MDKGGVPLRVAVLAPIAWRTPPRRYGPWELFASLLTEGLIELGHHVTLFATADSLTTARLISSSPCGWSEDSTIDAKVAECLHISAAFERADEFDIIHNSFDFLPLTYSGLVSTPVVTTVHGFSSEQIVPVYEKYNSSTTYVSISDADRHPRLRYAATIHHGINIRALTKGETAASSIAEGYLLFFGRIHPDKGTHHAIAVALRTGKTLLIAGPIHDEVYFAERVEPYLDGKHIRYLGNVAQEQKCALLSGAHALLHLIEFDEPFGFSVVEAMACGTPVIAHSRGSMPELVLNRQTGLLVGNVDDAVIAVESVSSLDRNEIRDLTSVRFDHRVMAQRYVDVYRQVVAQRT